MSGSIVDISQYNNNNNNTILFFPVGDVGLLLTSIRMINGSWISDGRYTNIGIGPMWGLWDNPKIRHFYWLLNRLLAIITNKNILI